VYYPWGAFVVGVIAGLQFSFWVQILTKLRVDDPMDTFAGKLRKEFYGRFVQPSISIIGPWFVQGMSH
jgi:ammonia channel protein AmtB